MNLQDWTESIVLEVKSSPTCEPRCHATHGELFLPTASHLLPYMFLTSRPEPQSRVTSEGGLSSLPSAGRNRVGNASMSVNDAKAVLLSALELCSR